MQPSHEKCLQALEDPSTQNILELFGYDYFRGGLEEFRNKHPDVSAVLVRAIVSELESNRVFPPRVKHCLPGVGIYLQKAAEGFLLVEIDKPSVKEEQLFGTSEAAARAYVYRTVDSYWLRSD